MGSRVPTMTRSISVSSEAALFAWVLFVPQSLRMLTVELTVL